MTHYKIACLDVWDEPVKNQTRDVAPDNFELVFAKSYDEDHQIEITQQCDFIMCGTAPVSRGACWTNLPIFNSSKSGE